MLPNIRRINDLQAHYSSWINASLSPQRMLFNSIYTLLNCLPAKGALITRARASVVRAPKRAALRNSSLRAPGSEPGVIGHPSFSHVSEAGWLRLKGVHAPCQVQRCVGKGSRSLCFQQDTNSGRAE